jgi:hypothetical protein
MHSRRAVAEHLLEAHAQEALGQGRSTDVPQADHQNLERLGHGHP